MRLRFTDAPSVRWDPAEVDETGELYLRGVDAGMIMISDMDDLRRAGGELGEELDAGLESSIDASEAYALRTLPGGGRYFSTTAGYGDGAYPVWWGFDAAGAATELIVEFDVLVRNTWAEFDIPIEQLRRPAPLVTPETEAAGVSIEVLDPQRAADEWNVVRSGGDPSGRLDADQIFAAVRRSGRATTDVTLFDGDGADGVGRGRDDGSPRRRFDVARGLVDLARHRAGDHRARADIPGPGPARGAVAVRQARRARMTRK